MHHIITTIVTPIIMGDTGHMQRFAMVVGTRDTINMIEDVAAKGDTRINIAGVAGIECALKRAELTGMLLGRSHSGRSETLAKSHGS